MNSNLIIKTVLCLTLFILSSCGKKAPVITVDNYQLLAQALAKNNKDSVDVLRQKVRLIENTQNIINIYYELDDVTAASVIPISELSLGWQDQYRPSLLLPV